MKKKQKNKKSIIVALCGMAIGFINGFFGGGGGMVCVPILEKYCKFEQKNAHATTLCIILPLSIVSSFVYISKNTLDFYQLCIITVGAILGGVLGAVFLKKIKSKYIRIIFAILMIVAGIKMVI